jgi:crossover junction endodeoxyribonuclease RusA
MEKKVKHTITVFAKPKVKERPRFGNGRTWTPKTTSEYEQKIKEAWDGPTFESTVSVDIILYKDKIKITLTEQEPKTKSTLRGDIDNYVKAILDGLNGSAFIDDKQVISIKARKA